MAEKFLNGAYIITVLQQVRGKGMTKAVRRSWFCDPGRANGCLHGPLQGFLFAVMAPFHAGLRIDAPLTGRKTYCQHHSRSASWF